MDANKTNFYITKYLGLHAWLSPFLYSSEQSNSTILGFSILLQTKADDSMNNKHLHPKELGFESTRQSQVLARLETVSHHCPQWCHWHHLSSRHFTVWGMNRTGPKNIVSKGASGTSSSLDVWHLCWPWPLTAHVNLQAPLLGSEMTKITIWRHMQRKFGSAILTLPESK